MYGTTLHVDGTDVRSIIGSHYSHAQLAVVMTCPVAVLALISLDLIECALANITYAIRAIVCVCFWHAASPMCTLLF